MAIYTSDSVFEKMEYQDFAALSQNEWLQELAAHIEKQIEPDNGVWRDERSEASQAASLPKEAQTVYYLWQFIVLTGGGGLEVFMSQGDEHAIKGSYQALREAGCQDAMKLLSDAISITVKEFDEKSSGCEFCNKSKDLSWFRTFHGSGLFDSINDIDDVFFEQLDMVDDFAIRYIDKNRDILVEEA